MFGPKTTAFAAAMIMTMTAHPAMATPSAFKRADWESLLPGCEQANNFFEAAQCIVKNSPGQCFSMSTPVDLYKCFKEEWEFSGWEDTGSIMGDIYEAALVCLDPYHDCIKNRVDAALANLPPCVKESAMEMAQCALDSPIECVTACLASSWDSPFEKLNIFDLLTCDGVSEYLLQPMCDVVSCCPPCLPALESMAECVVNDLLDFLPWREESCVFTCEDEEDRRVLRVHSEEEEEDGTIVVTPRTSGLEETEGLVMQIYDKCVSMVPGLFDRNQPSIQLTARSNFFDCVMKEVLALYGGDSAEEEEQEETSNSDEDEAPWWCWWC